jgi:hypothetical protein
MRVNLVVDAPHLFPAIQPVLSKTCTGHAEGPLHPTLPFLVLIATPPLVLADLGFIPLEYGTIFVVSPAPHPHSCK